MNNQEKVAEIVKMYLQSFHLLVEVDCNITKASYNDNENRHLCISDKKVIDMDSFAQNGYRKIYRPLSISVKDSINTADALMIDKDWRWYFIEFKDAKIGKSKASVLKKAYSNLYALLDILYTVSKMKDLDIEFDLSNPMEFVRNHITYLLVFSSKKNPNDFMQMKNHRLKREKYTPEFMNHLPDYIYKEAYAVDETVFVEEFLKKFEY